MNIRRCHLVITGFQPFRIDDDAAAFKGDMVCIDIPEAHECCIRGRPAKHKIIPTCIGLKIGKIFSPHLFIGHIQAAHVDLSGAADLHAGGIHDVDIAVIVGIDGPVDLGHIAAGIVIERVVSGFRTFKINGGIGAYVKAFIPLNDRILLTLRNHHLAILIIDNIFIRSTYYKVPSIGQLSIWHGAGGSQRCGHAEPEGRARQQACEHALF